MYIFIMHHVVIVITFTADLLLNTEPPSSIDRLDHEQHTNDAIDLLPRLQTGLDVNVKFSGVSAFEYTNTCVIFDQLNISLYHGWLTDPQEMNVAAAVGTLSYNQLVEKIITDKTSDDDEKVRIMILKNARHYLDLCNGT